MSVFPTPCCNGSCATITDHDSGYCEEHRGEAWDDDRPNFRERGYTSNWSKVSRAYRRKQPLCERCEGDGRTREADLVHHVTPIQEGGAKYHPDNLEALCRSCHAREHAS